LQFLIELVDVT